jgi:hypothetical protein
MGLAMAAGIDGNGEGEAPEVQRSRRLAKNDAERRQAVSAGEREYGVGQLQESEINQAHTIGAGPDAAELYLLRDGRTFRVAAEGERPHALFPKVTPRHPVGVPLVAVRWEDLTADEYEAQLRALKPATSAAPQYHWQGPRGAGGHERTDEGGARAEG